MEAPADEVEVEEDAFDSQKLKNTEEEAPDEEEEVEEWPDDYLHCLKHLRPVS